jgi:N-hydroxyarylamine O-acetyltransferase
MRRLDTDGYLERLGIADPGEPSVAGLRALHAAHAERVAYEAIEIQLGRPTTVDPYESAERIVARHRGGYCYHLNGAFSLLLSELGYDVVWHRAGVENRADRDYPGADRANHLALTVHGLPSRDCPSGSWWVDVGLGDALHDPLPLQEGEYVQGPFRYRLRPSEIEPAGWRFDHDPRGSFVGADSRAARATVEDFEERHAFLSSSPQSAFVTTCSVQRRDARGVDKLTGCVLHRIDGYESKPRTVENRSEWFEVLDEVFDLPLYDVDAAERDALWTRVRAAHDAWLAQRARGVATSA